MKTKHRLRRILPLTVIAFAVSVLPACKDITNDNSASGKKLDEIAGHIDFEGRKVQPKIEAPESLDIEAKKEKYAKEFRDIAANLFQRFLEKDVAEMPVGDGVSQTAFIEDLQKLFADIEVRFVTEELVKKIDGVEKSVDALNTPSEKLIQVNIARWEAMREVIAREKLVLHEIFGIAEIEKDDYTASNQALARLRGLENPQKIEDICARIGTESSYADYCVDEEIENLMQKVRGLEESLLHFADEKALEVPEDIDAKKPQLKTYIESRKASFAARMSASCSKADVVGGGREGAYNVAVCNYNFTLQHHAELKKYYDQIKARVPALPAPRMVPFSPEEDEE